MLRCLILCHKALGTQKIAISEKNSATNINPFLAKVVSGARLLDFLNFVPRIPCNILKRITTKYAKLSLPLGISKYTTTTN